MKMPLIDRLENKLMKDPNSGCWLFTACVTEDGYGQFGIGSRVFKAHRVSWELHNGPIPDGLIVCHKCDTPPCCNPDHLFLGTKADNRADMVAKGRGYDSHGERNPRAKLTREQVLEIRSLPFKRKDVADRFGVSRELITAIVTRRVWANI